MNANGKLWTVGNPGTSRSDDLSSDFSDDVSTIAADDSTALTARMVASDATSMAVSSTYLIYTTTSHESKYASLEVLRKVASDGTLHAGDQIWESRRVERGSRIVTVVPSAMSLVLQMPINPRSLVLEVVKREIHASVTTLSVRVEMLLELTFTNHLV
jgi:cysteine synthase